MAVTRSLYAVASVSETIDTLSTLNVDIPRPQTPVQTDTYDFVVQPYAQLQFESGRCAIVPDSNFGIAGMLLAKLEIIALNPGNSLAPINLSFSEFPENDILTGPGFTSTTLRTICDFTANPAGSLYTMAPTDYKTIRLLSNIIVRADEFVRVWLYNSTGGNIAGQLTATYDMGLNADNIGTLPILI
jgi:hypothetical protein